MAFTSEHVFAKHLTLFQPYISFCLFSVFMQTGYTVGLMLKISGDDICLKYMQATMMVDRSSHGSRNLIDQYRDMRLDIDNMSYEELLALGERMGNVSTGLSENVISRCLMETTYSSSKLILEEERCAICLEEYKNEEEVGTVKNCGHDYHVGCIKKWLLKKNTCPICKAPLSDSLEEKY
ncbi:probable E3 ubiquitin-protein ligase HIP1 [Alnus glutinosa]|uniref:probable E3 ubiquitin-protein ligase HIP1 n=1 Tax=Alnus glutinosa TaxID=3517 RepID=UPI002D77A3C7|nr:probable E3 ubiquitin-protein ligase HIP1 [Alnus glutinosa]